MAYLADLLDFCLRRLKNNGADVTLTFLQDRFHQPFRDLPATCAAMEKKLRQVRICIEVLRGYVPAPDGAATAQSYLETACTNLLRALGTSFEEIRRMRTVTAASMRQALATRLGIALSSGRALPNTTDEIDRLFLDTDLRAPQARTVARHRRTRPRRRHRRLPPPGLRADRPRDRRAGESPRRPGAARSGPGP